MLTAFTFKKERKTSVVDLVFKKMITTCCENDWIKVDRNDVLIVFSTVTVAPWGQQQQQHQGGGSSLGDTSTFDRLRDTCNKMFLRDGNLRGSSQFAAALSPTLPRVTYCFYVSILKTSHWFTCDTYRIGKEPRIQNKSRVSSSSSRIQRSVQNR